MGIKQLTCILDFFTNINETYDHSSYLFRSINYREHHLKPLYRPKLAKYCTPVKLPSSAMGINANCEEKSNEHLTKSQTPRPKLFTNFRRCFVLYHWYPLDSTLDALEMHLIFNFMTYQGSGLKAPAEPSCRPTWFIFQYHLLWRLKAISGRLIIIVNSYNLILIAISLRLIKMSINRPGCGLQENDDFLEINAFLIKIP